MSYELIDKRPLLAACQALLREQYPGLKFLGGIRLLDDDAEDSDLSDFEDDVASVYSTDEDESEDALEDLLRYVCEGGKHGRRARLRAVRHSGVVLRWRWGERTILEVGRFKDQGSVEGEREARERVLPDVSNLGPRGRDTRLYIWLREGVLWARWAARGVRT